MRWSDQSSSTGMPGLLDSTAIKFHPGQGYHASLSRFDMHNTLIAAGPDFKKQFVDETPSGNIDIAPTVLAVLGISQPKAMDGRVLNEALVHSSHAAPEPHTELLESTLNHGSTRWHQYLRITRIGATTYFDEGNGSEARADQGETAVRAPVRDWKAVPRHRSPGSRPTVTSSPSAMYTVNLPRWPASSPPLI